MFDSSVHIEQFHVANRLVHRPQTERSEVLPDLFRHVAEERSNELRFTVEALTQHWICVATRLDTYLMVHAYHDSTATTSGAGSGKPYSSARSRRQSPRHGLLRRPSVRDHHVITQAIEEERSSRSARPSSTVRRHARRGQRRLPVLPGHDPARKIMSARAFDTGRDGASNARLQPHELDVNRATAFAFKLVDVAEVRSSRCRDAA